MKRDTWLRIITAAALLPLFVTCSFETDGKFAGLVAGYEKEQLQLLQPPANVQAAGDSSGGIQISWDIADNADGYTIYRAPADNPTGIVRRGSSGGTGYIDSGALVPPNTPFYYYVTAWRGGETSKPSEWAGPAYAVRNQAILEAPEIISAVASGNDITVTWTAVNGADGYILYRASIYDGGVYIFRITVNISPFTDEDLAAGSYLYQVRGYNDDGEGYVSLPSDSVSIVGTGPVLPAPAKPGNLRAAASYPSQLPVVAVSWNAVANADSYHVYRSVDDEYYEKIGEVSSTTYQDNTGIISGEAYYYRVRGYNGTQEGYLSDSCGPVLLLPGKPEIAAAVTDNTITISWVQVYGADIYYVYRSTDDSQFQLLTTRGIANTSYMDLGLAMGDYYYRVEAANSAGRGFPSDSRQAIVTVNAETPLIGVHPAGGNTYLPNVPATALSVQASVSDGGTLSYQWYRNTADSNTGGTLVSSAASYTPPTNTAGTVYYYAVVTNTNNSVNGNKTATAVSNVAAITVMGSSSGTAGIVINLTDENEWNLVEQTAQAEAGVDTEFTVVGTYAAYQWYLDGALVGTGSSYILNKTAGVYELAVVVRNAAGEGRSGSCRVTVSGSDTVGLTASTAAEFATALSAIQGSSNDDFTVTVTADLSLSPQDLTLAAYRNKTITLRGNTPARTISLSGQGSLFTVGADTELVLEDIVLAGRSDNNASLVKVNTDGKLVLNSRGKVTGNTYSTSVANTGGAGIFVDGGTLEIAGGEISGNTVNGSFSGSTTYHGDICGGGVYAANGSSVLMTGGVIRNNSITNIHTEHGGVVGGGISVHNNTRFEMFDGIIEGNVISDQSTSWESWAQGGGVFSGHSSFYLRGGKIRNNTANATASGSSFGEAFGGGFFGGGNDNNFIMSGGVINGNRCTSSSNPNFSQSIYIAGAYGGGVLFQTTGGGSFEKTGGIIYGNEVEGNDADGIPLKNTAQSESGGLGGGHAVFYRENNPNRRRNSTAYENHNMDSGATGSAGGWE